jgi:outer membrane immunogenic protein
MHVFKSVIFTKLSLCLGLTLAPHPAFADDWSGFYLGVSGGYFNADTKIKGPTGIFPNINFNSDGGLVGGYAGYNFQIEQVILGIEGNVHAGWGSDTIFAGLPVPSQLKTTAKASWSVRARAGWSLENFMPYIAGGYTGKTNKLTLGIGYLGDDDLTLSGWTIGGGVEYMITPRWLTRIDYQYKDYGKRSFFGSLHPDFAGAKQKVTQNQVTVGGAFKF